MSPPLRPVPSKAAIHALRGLALGTSCAIGLIVEDRRRRICTLRTAVDNKKKLRSSKQYHSTAEAAAIPVDNAHGLSGDDLRWNYRQDPQDDFQQRLAGKYEQIRHDSAAQVSRPGPDEISRPVTDAVLPDEKPGSQPHQPTEAPLPLELPPINMLPSGSGIGLHTSRDSGGWARGPPIDNTAEKEKQENSGRPDVVVRGLIGLLESAEASLDQIISDFMAEIQKKNVIFREEGQYRDDWLKLSVAICKHCQEKGRMEDAQKILVAIVQEGVMHESRFYDHNPIPMIESALSAADVDKRISGTKSLQVALRLFLAKFVQKPQSHADDIERLGRTLITRLIDFNRPTYLHIVYQRVLGQLRDPTAFVAWFIRALFHYQDYKSVIKYFRLNFSKLSPDDVCFNEVFELVLYSLEETKGLQVEGVVRSLAQMVARHKERELKTAWLMRLSQAHWGRYGDETKSMDLFGQYLSSGLLDRVRYPEFVYKVMVQFACLAGRETMAHDIHDQLIEKFPLMETDIGLNGYFTTAKAKNGNWHGVLEDFTKMRDHRDAQNPAIQHIGKSESDYSLTFVNILKVFVRSHSSSEIEDFIRFYVNKMQVQLHPYMVALVANKYGEGQDVDGFIEWLRYCGTTGFALRPGFANAVLLNCQKKWHYPFRKLRLLFNAIREIEPKCVDSVTQRIMHNAAIKASPYQHTTRQRVGSLKLSMNRLPSKLRPAPQRDVFEAMQFQFYSGFPVRALIIYKRAMQFGLPWCPRCFNLAVMAALKQGNNNYNLAIKLIHDSHQEGRDVTRAVEAFIKAQIDNIRGSFEQIMLHLKTVIARFESVGIIIDTRVLTHFAIVCTKFGHNKKAITLCKVAMERNGTENPCFSRQSIRVLLSAYEKNLDIDGIKWVVGSLPSSPFACDLRTKKLLGSALKHLKKWQDSPLVLELKQVLRDGIEESKRRRQEERADGSMIYEETLRIMGDAVAEAERLRQEEQQMKLENSKVSWESLEESILRKPAPSQLQASF